MRGPLCLLLGGFVDVLSFFFSMSFCGLRETYSSGQGRCKLVFFLPTSWSQLKPHFRCNPPRDKYGKKCKILCMSVITMALRVFLRKVECQRPTGTR